MYLIGKQDRNTEILINKTIFAVCAIKKDPTCR